jgi:hypothetical protein
MHDKQQVSYRCAYPGCCEAIALRYTMASFMRALSHKGHRKRLAALGQQLQQLEADICGVCVSATTCGCVQRRGQVLTGWQLPLFKFCEFV